MESFVPIIENSDIALALHPGLDMPVGDEQKGGIFTRRKPGGIFINRVFTIDPELQPLRPAIQRRLAAKRMSGKKSVLGQNCIAFAPDFGKTAQQSIPELGFAANPSDHSRHDALLIHILQRNNCAPYA